MSLDLKIPGDRAALLGLAEWLAPDLSAPLINADLDLASAWGDSEYLWTGQAGDAFRSAIMRIRDGSSALPAFLQDIAEVLRAYSNRLGRGQELFDEFATEAIRAGLMVENRIIAPPMTWVQACPTGSAPPEVQEEYDRYLRKSGAYDRICAACGTWWGDTDEWIVDNLAPLIARIEDLKPISALNSYLQTLKAGNSDVIGAGLTYASVRVGNTLASRRQQYNARQLEMGEYRRRLRSGNPKLNAAARAANPKEMRAGLKALNTAIVRGVNMAKVIPVAGGMVTVVSTAVELAEGGSPSSIGASLLGGAAGAAGGAAAVGAIVAAPVAIAVGAGFVAVAGAGAAVWLWEAAVPLDIREAIDDALVRPRPTFPSVPTFDSATGSLR